MTNFAPGKWLNEPLDWGIKSGKLNVTTGFKTDFWRHTHYGFVRDSGHFWQLPAPKTFTASLTFEGSYETLYDQAGLMLRVDEKNWIKCGIEHSDGMTNFSIVITRDSSDWSVIGQPLISGPQTIRITAQDNSIIAHFLKPNGTWNLMRVADFPTTKIETIGPMACSPERCGFKASFLDFKVTNPVQNSLHS